MRVLFFGLAMLVAVPQLFAQGNAPTYDVNRVGDAAPVIDGIVSPGEWDAAATAAGGWVDLRTHQPDTHNLRFQALWDDENIYLLGQSDWDAFPEGPSVQPSNPNFGGGSYNPNFYFDPNTDDEVFLPMTGRWTDTNSLGTFSRDTRSVAPPRDRQLNLCVIR